LRRASVSGYSQNSQGKWMYSIDVMGIDARTRRSSDSRLSRESDSYVIRRRFNDFKQLHEELSASGHLCVDRLPSLPYYGIVSYLQQLFSPREILEQRVQKLQEILEFINSSPILSLTEPYMKFIGKKPCSIDIGYVSLSSYEVPEHECNLKLVERLRGRTLSG
jgi:hypothetical protein